ncbi:MAG TPA: hypothetical protein VI542_16265, partial [Candidatus Tectomicrobia bacterium]
IGHGPIVGVQFLLDGQPVGDEQCCSTNEIRWDTTAAMNGNHTLAARARSATGDTVTTPAETILIANAPPWPALPMSPPLGAR